VPFITEKNSLSVKGAQRRSVSLSASSKHPKLFPMQIVRSKRCPVSGFGARKKLAIVGANKVSVNQIRMAYSPGFYSCLVPVKA
jgi:hypothetical protein